MIFIKLISIIIFLSSYLFADIKVVNNSIAKNSYIKTLKGEKKSFLSTRDFVSSLSSRLYENAERKKLVLYISGKRIKVSAGTSFLIIDDSPYQMVDAVQEYNGDLYVPAQSFFDILQEVVIPGLRYDERKETLEFDIIRYNVRSLDIEENDQDDRELLRRKHCKNKENNKIDNFLNTEHGQIQQNELNADLQMIEKKN